MKNIFDEEEFKPLMRFQKVVPGYFVTKDGRVFSLKSNKFLRPRKKYTANHHSEKRLKELAFNVSAPKELITEYNFSDKSGRLNNSIELYISNHRATAEAWMSIDDFPPPQLKECWDVLPEEAKQWVRDTAIVDHKDDDPSNNHVDNLQWVIPKDNNPYRKASKND